VTDSRKCLLALIALVSSSGQASAQAGAQATSSPLSCMVNSGMNSSGLRPESYTELVDDILIVCYGGSALQVGSAVPTVNMTVVMSPAVPITSRILGPSGSFASEAMLTIDEPGSGQPTEMTGGYGPQAPQSLCTTAQQLANKGAACAAQAGLDRSGQYQVAVQPNSSTPAQNVYQGKIGDYGPNSVTFYNVPVLPPGFSGARIFRIANIRVSVAGEANGQTIEAAISTPSNALLQVAASIPVGMVIPATTATVNASPSGGGNPFWACVPTSGPTLAAKVVFQDGSTSGFKTRVIPGGATYGVPGSSGNTTWAAEAQNLVSPSNQNIPGSIYGNFIANNESAFILPAAAFTDTASNVTYTAGLADFGTRLKAVFTNIPAGVSLYVSTTNAAGYAIPGGASTTPYAVLVAAAQSEEANLDGSAFKPLTSTVTGSDGRGAYLLTPDNSGQVAAVWEVANASPSMYSTLTFSVYVAYSGKSGTTIPTNVALSFSPEPGGGTFSTAGGPQALTGPVPRFAVRSPQGGPFATINQCSLLAATTPVSFSYTIGATAPSSQNLAVTTSPTNLPVSVTPSVATPAPGNWLSASLTGGSLKILADPTNLTASVTPYAGTVKLSHAGASDVLVPVTFLVSAPSSGCTAATVSDVNRALSQGQGLASPTLDLNSDGAVNIVDMQNVIDAAMSDACLPGSGK